MRCFGDVDWSFLTSGIVVAMISAALICASGYWILALERADGDTRIQIERLKLAQMQYQVQSLRQMQMQME